MLGNMDALADMYDFLVDCGLANICRSSYLRIVERLTVGSFAYMSESDKRKAFVQLRKILAPFREKLEDFRLLALAADGKEKRFPPSGLLQHERNRQNKIFRSDLV